MGQNICTSCTNDNQKGQNSNISKSIIGDSLPTFESSQNFQNYNINANYNVNYNFNISDSSKNISDLLYKKAVKSKKKNNEITISEEIGKILFLEQKINNGEISESILKDLMFTYSKIVEHYDKTHDPIKSYFVDKIQNILSHKKTLQYLVSKVDTPSEKHRRISNVTDLDIKTLRDFDEQSVNESIFNDRTLLDLSHNSSELKKKRSLDFSPVKIAINRLKNIKIYANIDYSKQKREISNIISNYTDCIEFLDMIINQDINVQTQLYIRKLEKRNNLLKRKKLNLQKKSQNVKNKTFITPVLKKANKKGSHKKSTSVQIVTPIPVKKFWNEDIE